MANNDDVVFGIPQIQCPSCGSMLDTSRGRFDKLSSQQRKKSHERGYESMTGYTPTDKSSNLPSEMPDNNFIVVSCENHFCEQYNKIKVLKIPRLDVKTAKFEL